MTGEESSEALYRVRSRQQSLFLGGLFAIGFTVLGLALRGGAAILAAGATALSIFWGWAWKMERDIDAA